MSIKLMTRVWEMPYAKHIRDKQGKWSVAHGKLLVLLKLADHCNDDGWCWPSQQTIADACGVSRRWVSEILKQLVEDGVLEMERGQRSNKMHLMLDRAPEVQIDAPRGTEVHGDAGGDADENPVHITNGAPTGPFNIVYGEKSVPSDENPSSHKPSENRQEDSVPNGTGGPAAVPVAPKPLGPFPDLAAPKPTPPTDSTVNPFDPTVLAFFTDRGCPERSARSIIGGALRDYGKEAVADVLTDMFAQGDVMEPRSYFHKLLQEHRLKNPVLPTLAEAAQQAARYLTVRSLPNGNPIAAV